MFSVAVQVAQQLPEEERSLTIARLTHVRSICQIGYGIGETMAYLLAEDIANRETAESSTAVPVVALRRRFEETDGER